MKIHFSAKTKRKVFYRVKITAVIILTFNENKPHFYIIESVKLLMHQTN